METEPGMDSCAEQETEPGTEFGIERGTESETESEIEPGTGCCRMYHTGRNLHDEIDTIISSKRYYCY